jgi:hypothetical protein
MARGVAWGRPGAEEVDMMEVRDRVRRPWSAAMTWLIIPPMDTPATWAVSTPAASSTAMASAAMSSRV